MLNSLCFRCTLKPERIKGTEAFTGHPSDSTKCLCSLLKAVLRVRTGDTEKKRAKEEQCVCACETCVKAMENMIAGRDVRSL